MYIYVYTHPTMISFFALFHFLVSIRCLFFFYFFFFALASIASFALAFFSLLRIGFNFAILHICHFFGVVWMWYLWLAVVRLPLSCHVLCSVYAFSVALLHDFFVAYFHLLTIFFFLHNLLAFMWWEEKKIDWRRLVMPLFTCQSVYTRFIHIKVFNIIESPQDFYEYAIELNMSLCTLLR